MMIGQKTTFAVMFGNRGFFPSSLQSSARTEMQSALKKLGHDCLMLPEGLTSHGAVESPEDGEIFANFLRENHGKFSGVILCLPNFGDELGATAALKDAGVPIFIHAYPDELGKMAPEFRRDAFCGKFAMTDVFRQFGIKYTTLSPHVVHPSSDEFRENIEYFDRLCRVVKGLKGLHIGALGARTTPFKSVRYDELTLQKHNIDVETFDLSAIIQQTRELADDAKEVKAKGDELRSVMLWNKVPEESFGNLAKLGVVMDRIIAENHLNAIAIRCWIELQQQLGISPCVLDAMLCDKGIPVACEVDVTNAVVMYALQSATGNPAIILDWNNNYGTEPDKCIVFHCGNAPHSMMVAPAEITSHAILDNVLGKGCSFGCNWGRLSPIDMTFGSLMTEDGKAKMYIGEGKITEDPIPDNFFGSAGVAEIPNLQAVLKAICQGGYRHHVSLSAGNVAEPMTEALENYVGFEITRL